jgi:pyruvate,water dikinase
LAAFDHAGKDDQVMHDADPQTQQSPDDIAWTTVNISEALPQVPTPLTWWLFEHGCEMGARRAFVRIGLFTDADERDPRPESRMFGIFSGHPAINVNRTRWIADRTPGTTADAQEQAWFGQVRSGLPSRRTARRVLPLVAKAPRTYRRLGADLAAARSGQHQWYVERIAALAGGADPATIFAEIPSRLVTAFEYHSLGTQMATVALQQLTAACAAAGVPGLELEIGAGTSELIEHELLDDLGALATGRIGLETFLSRHGYNGPDTFELSAPSWRERPESLDPLLDRYRHGRQPEARSRAERVAAKAAAVERLMEASGWRYRLRSRLAVALASRYIPMRETGKAMFVEVFDVARAAARRWGAQLHASGILESPDDIVYLTHHELLAGTLSGDVGQLAAERRRRRTDVHSKVSLPLFWFGEPELTGIDDIAATTDDGEAGNGDSDGTTVLVGVGASAGVVSGLVRVVHDPTNTEFVEGEVLVCHTTDPSWVGLMYLAAALVIDVGGVMSHGAIIARELGVPCVIGAAGATHRLRDGTHVRVDGTAGTVAVDRSAGDRPGDDQVARATARAEIATDQPGGTR